MKNLISILLLAILGVYFNETSQAQETKPEELVTDRPGQAVSSRTIPKNTLQIETGVQREEIKTEEFKTLIIQYPTTLVKIGLFKNIEIRLINQFINTKIINKENSDTSIFGIDNLTFGIKTNICSEKGIRPEIAFFSHLVLPTGSEFYRSKKVLPDLIFSLSHTFSDKLSLGYNIGWAADEENNNGNGIYTLGIGYGISEKFGGFIETFGKITNMEDVTINLDAGFAYLVKNNFQLDISGGRDLKANSYFLSCGISFRLPK